MRASAGAVGFELAFIENEPEQIEILDHAAMLKMRAQLSMKLCCVIPNRVRNLPSNAVCDLRDSSLCSE
jgi:hypothetical protein